MKKVLAEPLHILFGLLFCALVSCAPSESNMTSIEKVRYLEQVRDEQTQVVQELLSQNTQLKETIIQYQGQIDLIKEKLVDGEVTVPTITGEDLQKYKSMALELERLTKKMEELKDPGKSETPLSEKNNTDFTAITTALSSQQTRNSVSTIPNTVELKKSFPVSFTITSKEVQEVVSKAQSLLGSGYTVSGESISVSPVVTVELIADESDFNILPHHKLATQNVLPDGDTTWKWEVQALKEGEKELTITVNSEYTINGEKIPRFINSYQKNLIVYVKLENRVLEFISIYWQFIIGTVLLPIVLLYLEKRFSVLEKIRKRFRKKKKSNI